MILVGLGFDALLQIYEPEKSVTATDKDLMALLDRSGARPSTLVSGAKVSVYSVNDFANTQMSELLRKGDILVVHDEHARQLIKLSTNQRDVIMVSQAVEHATRSSLYNVLVVGFYLLIAAVVFLWVWPLSRDLRKLELQTRLVGQDHLDKPLSLRQTSPVYDVASSFNRMSERVKALLASHKEMTYAVSHELRTPLARMKFALAMADNAKGVEPLKRQLASIKEDVAEMDTLVNQLLAYAGFESSAHSLDQQPGDMAYLLHHLVSRIASAEPQFNVECEVNNELADNQPVTCEWHLMERAIANLLQNARRFAKSKVLISLFDDDDCFYVTVEDDGAGVQMAERERIFQSFVRLSNHPNTKVRGFGLGLAIVMRVALWHTGGVEVVDGERLGGAKFCLWWRKVDARLVH